jgi:hypothetical protein
MQQELRSALSTGLQGCCGRGWNWQLLWCSQYAEHDARASRPIVGQLNRGMYTQMQQENIKISCSSYHYNLGQTLGQGIRSWQLQLLPAVFGA